MYILILKCAKLLLLITLVLYIFYLKKNIQQYHSFKINLTMVSIINLPRALVHKFKFGLAIFSCNKCSNSCRISFKHSAMTWLNVTNLIHPSSIDKTNCPRCNSTSTPYPFKKICRIDSDIGIRKKENIPIYCWMKGPIQIFLYICQSYF